MRTKKVCFVSTAASAMKRYTIHIARALVAEGMNVTLICSDDKQLTEMCEKDGIVFIPLNMKRGLDIKGPMIVRELEWIFESEKFDLVSYCSPNASYYASTAAKRLKVPVRVYCQWGIRYVGLNGLPRRIFKAVERSVCASSTHIRPVSEKNLEFDVEEKLFDRKKALVLGNGGTVGVDTELFDISKKADFRAKTRKDLDISEDEFVFGFCGRFSRDKGAAELIGAFRDLTASGVDATLLVVGEFEDLSGVSKELLEWARESDRVIFTERIDESEVCEYYPAMDVLVHPTYREGFGMVIQEAGAFGVPSITTDVPGASEVMEDGVSCVLVPARDKDSLADAMRRFYDDRSLCKKLGDKAYERTVSLYTRPVMLEYQLKDYMSLLERR